MSRHRKRTTSRKNHSQVPIPTAAKEFAALWSQIDDESQLKYMTSGKSMIPLEELNYAFGKTGMTVGKLRRSMNSLVSGVSLIPMNIYAPRYQYRINPHYPDSDVGIDNETFTSITGKTVSIPTKLEKPIRNSYKPSRFVRMKNWLLGDGFHLWLAQAKCKEHVFDFIPEKEESAKGVLVCVECLRTKSTHHQ